MSVFSQRLKEARLGKNVSQEVAAKGMGISRSALGNYEQGTREPDHETLEAMADYYNLDYNYLLGRKDYTTIIPTDIIYSVDGSEYVIEVMTSRNEDMVKRMITYAKKLLELQKLEEET